MSRSKRAIAYVFGIYNSALTVIAIYNSEWLFAGLYVSMALFFGAINFISE